MARTAPMRAPLAEPVITFQMKHLILITTLFFLGNISQCQIAAQRDKWEYSKWPTQYKERAFCLCLLEGYQDTTLKRKLLEVDKSYYDPVSIAIFDKTLSTIIKSEVDSINMKYNRSIGRISEVANGKRVFNHCLEFYESRRLDLMMQSARKEWNEIKDIDLEIEKTMPWF